MRKPMKQIMVVMTPAAYKVFEEWLKQYPQYRSDSCVRHPAAGQPLENKEVGHETGN